MSKLVTFGLLCVAALVVASCSREDRRCVVTAAGVILANWMLFVLPWVYNPLSPAHLLKVIGLPATHEDMWALADLASLLTICWYGRDLWWTGLLIGPYLAMLATLATGWAEGADYGQYALMLDRGLLVQLAVIFWLGGDGVLDRLSAGWRRGQRWLASVPVLATHLAGTPR